MKRSPAVTTLTAAVLALAACGGSDAGTGDGDTTLRVAAAASLTDSFEDIAKTYEKEHDGVEVELQFAGSSDLASQIEGGSDVDVFASADEPNMDKVKGMVKDPTIFATNTLTIVTEPGNPEEITGMKDLENPDLAVVVCAPEVPCGNATQRLATKEDVNLHPASEEAKVTDVLAKVTSGEADAGLVYVTDATGAGDDVTAVDPKGADAVVNDYPVATLKESASPKDAQAFVDLVTGTEGQKVLQDHGFGAP